MSLRILIVDDSSIIRAVVRRSIALSGLDVGEILEAQNGAEALQVLSDKWVDIVFADLNMPVMNGVEMVRRMAQDSLLETIPVVIVSSEQNEGRIEELKRLGIRAYLKKPFRPESFRDVVRSLLG